MGILIFYCSIVVTADTLVRQSLRIVIALLSILDNTPNLTARVNFCSLYIMDIL